MNSKTTVKVHKEEFPRVQTNRRKMRMPLAAKVLSSALSVALLIAGTAGTSGAAASNGSSAAEASLQSHKGAVH